jgi:hypothetical protein
VQRGTGKLAVAVEPHLVDQTDLLPDVVERVGWLSFRMAVWPTLV